MFTEAQLDSIIKAYDIRGLVDGEVTAEFAFALGCAYAKFLEEEREPSTVVIGEDMRPSSPILASAFADGVTSQGFDVIRIGLASTDLLYFAAGKLNLPGAMFTASHNPAEYNGIKLCKSGARPIGKESGLVRIRGHILNGVPISLRSPGISKNQPMLEEYAEFLLSLFDADTTKKARRLKVVIDAGNGMAGYMELFLITKRIPSKRRISSTCRSASKKRVQILGLHSMVTLIDAFLLMRKVISLIPQH